MNILYLADGLFDVHGAIIAHDFGVRGSGHDVTIIPLTSKLDHLILSDSLAKTPIHILGQDSISSQKLGQIKFYNNYGSFKLRNLWTG